MRSRLSLLAIGALLGATILGPMAAMSGQTRMDQAITRLAGSPFTELFDLDARADTLETSTTALQAAAAKGRLVTVTVGAEDANVIALTISVDNMLGADAAGAVRLQVRLWSNAHFTTATNAAAFPLTDGGDGTIEATDGGVVSVIVLTGASTRVQLNCTDAATASGATVYGTVEVLGAGPVVSAKTRFTATFDGA
jgi:hypothetical protein